SGAANPATPWLPPSKTAGAAITASAVLRMPCRARDYPSEPSRRTRRDRPRLAIVKPPVILLDQSLSGAIVPLQPFAGSKRGQKVVGQAFTQLYPPLIEGVEIPDHALAEHLMFV